MPERKCCQPARRWSQPPARPRTAKPTACFALSLDNDSCRSPEGLGVTPSPAERPPKKLYLPKQKPLTHFQVGSGWSIVPGLGSSPAFARGCLGSGWYKALAFCSSWQV